MLVTELIGVKNTQSDMNVQDVLAAIFAGGKIQLSSGTISLVLLPKGKKYVYKVWYQDTGFEAFLRFIESHKGNSALLRPLSKIRKVKMKFKDAEKTFSVLKVEKLTPMTDDDYDLLDEFLSAVHEHEPLDRFNSSLGKDFVTAMDDLSKSSSIEAAYDIDIETPNIMKRGSQFVIMDPLRGDDETTVVDDFDAWEYSA